MFAMTSLCSANSSAMGWGVGILKRKLSMAVIFMSAILRQTVRRDYARAPRSRHGTHRGPARRRRAPDHRRVVRRRPDRLRGTRTGGPAPGAPRPARAGRAPARQAFLVRAGPAPLALPSLWYDRRPPHHAIPPGEARLPPLPGSSVGPAP